MPSYPQQAQLFSPQTRPKFQNINHPCPMNQNQFQNQMQSHGNQSFQNYFMQPQRSAGDTNQNFMQSSISCDQQAFNSNSGMSCPTNSFKQPEVQYQSYEKHQNPDPEEEPSDEEEVNIEYFQCSPSPSTVSKHQNPFNPVMESMRQYSTTKPVQKSHAHSEKNHQTFEFTHEDEGCEKNVDLTKQKLYRSNTRIVSIPNGIQIITEILKDDNNDDSDESSSQKCSNRKTQNDDEWMNKRIEVSVDDVQSCELIRNNSET